MKKEIRNIFHSPQTYHIIIDMILNPHNNNNNFINFTHELKIICIQQKHAIIIFFHFIWSRLLIFFYPFFLSSFFFSSVRVPAFCEKVSSRMESFSSLPLFELLNAGRNFKLEHKFLFSKIFPLLPVRDIEDGEEWSGNNLWKICANKTC